MKMISNARYYCFTTIPPRHQKDDKRGADMHLLDTILRKLSKGIPLDPHHKDYALTGNYKGFRECHI
ncbi:type II toxin-antitoxin system YafQ family toxin [Alloscardovia omnicolens]